MKILQVNKFLYPRGGTETYLLSLIDLLKKNNQEVFCFSQKNSKNIKTNNETLFIDNLELGKFSFSSLIKLPRIFWSFKARKLIKKIIKKDRPDIVHIHNIYHQLSPSILPIIKKQGLPIVMTVHDLKLITPNYTLRADNKKTYHKNSFLTQLILNLEFEFHQKFKIYQNNIDLFIAPSEFVKNKLIENNFPAEKIKVIPHFLIKSPKNKKTKKEKIEKYIFAYGRLDESKGFDDLIKAFANLATNDLKLKIAGDGPEKEDLKKLAKDLKIEKQIEFLGKKNQGDLAQLITNSLFVVNCSKVHETFGLTVLESMALGKAIIASNVGAIPELIEHNKNGLLYQTGNIKELKKYLSKLINNKELIKKLGNEAKISSKSFSAEKHYHNLIDSYSKVKKENKKPIRRVNESLVNVILFLLISFLILIPFYQINIEPSRAIILATHKYPKLANLYWRNPITPEVAKELAKWDLLALDMTAQVYSADTIKLIREINPEIIILAYTTANEMPIERLESIEPQGYGLWHELAKGNKVEWQLKTIGGENVTFWPGNILMNKNARDKRDLTYGDYLIDFYVNKVLSTGLWDGLIFDNTWKTVAWINSEIDIDNDGQIDSDDKINNNWVESQKTFFEKLRNRVGDNYLIIGNGEADLSDFNNGRMFESFPEYWEGGWNNQMKNLTTLTDNGFDPIVNIINSDSGNTGNQFDFKSMRFGLTSALLLDAYFSFDYGPNLREHLWWYDEYDVDLGKPYGSAFNNLDINNSEFKAGLWQRNYENGIVLVNSTKQPTTIYFSQKYKKIKGIQDKDTNNGRLIYHATIPAMDGLILLKENY